MAKFESMQLRNMVAVGATTASSVRLWMRSEVAGEHQIEIWSEKDPQEKVSVLTTIAHDNLTDNTHAVCYPDEFPHANLRLRPLARYRFKVLRVIDGTPLGEGRFETAPEGADETPEKFSMAVMSCHQPFNTDGELSGRSMRMLRLVPRLLRDYDVKFILHCGDQIYADIPENFSLLKPHYIHTKLMPEKESIFDCSIEEIRSLYQQRYRIFWSMNEIRHIYANYPGYPILDDHEIMDDWGSNPNHCQDRFSKLAAGAREAYFDYQGSRVTRRNPSLPPSFHYQFEYGSVGVFVMDIRSERIAKEPQHQLYSQSQFEEFKTFLNKNAQKHVLVIVVSVPVVHLPSWLVDIGASLVGDTIDFPDHWSYKKNKAARDLFLSCLHDHQEAHPHQRVILVSGDVHIGCVFAIHWRDGNKPILYQFTSSALSNRLQKMEAYFSSLGPEFVSHLDCGRGHLARVNLLKAAEGADDNNPFGGLNIGIIEIKKGIDHSNVTLKLIGYGPEEEFSHQEMFGSGIL